MISFSGELWVLLAGVLLAGVRLALTGRRRRWRALVARSRELGWGTERRDQEGLPARYGQLELMRHGYNRRVRDVIMSHGPRPARAFCYHYEIGFGKRHESRDLTVAVVETEADWPGVWVGPARGIEATGTFGRYRPVAPAQSGKDQTPGDSCGARVYGESVRCVGCDPGSEILGMPGAVEGAAARTCEVRGSCVAVYEDRIGSAASQIELLARAEALADRLERIRAIEAENAMPSKRSDRTDSAAAPGGSRVE